MGSVSTLKACAAGHLKHYTDPKGSRAFASYDWLGDPDPVYGVTPRAPGRLWEPLREDLTANSAWLTPLAAVHQTPDGRQLTALRALDIVLWEHSWGCTV